MLNYINTHLALEKCFEACGSIELRLLSTIGAQVRMPALHGVPEAGAMGCGGIGVGLGRCLWIG